MIYFGGEGNKLLLFWDFSGQPLNQKTKQKNPKTNHPALMQTLLISAVGGKVFQLSQQ